jgi:hypothetical protein
MSLSYVLVLVRVRVRVRINPAIRAAISLGNRTKQIHSVSHSCFELHPSACVRIGIVSYLATNTPG